MYLVCPCHTAECLKQYGLGVEAHIGRSERLEDWERFVPFVRGVHLPYSHLNLASLDDSLRQESIETLKNAVDIGCAYAVDKMVMHTVGIESWPQKWGDAVVGSYERMIDGIRQLADHAAKKKITLCIENSAMHAPGRRIYGVSAQEWYQIYLDVAKPNVLLTLDTSHAATAAAFLYKDGTDEERFGYLYEFLKHPEAIGRVHWSDSLLTDAQAYMKDLHLLVGSGDLPRAFHQRIKALDAQKLFEHTQTEEELAEELFFVQGL